jgi:spermidine synthase
MTSGSDQTREVRPPGGIPESTTRRLLFLLFFVSGFCGLVYQVVWIRMAFASFGIITPVLSVVISVFMLGLSLGSWAGGRYITALTRRTGHSAALYYGGAELLIGLGAFAVPGLFVAGERLLLATGQTDSLGYLSFSALVLALSILPWCVFMGTTFPFMLAYVRERDAGDRASFSYLYLANVLGAMSGVGLTAIVLVEVLGFRHTLWLAAAGNFTIALIAGGLGWSRRGCPIHPVPEAEPAMNPAAPMPSPGSPGRTIKWILFCTGFSAMAMEVVWVRAFTPVLKTQVYSFAMILFTYLGATFLGTLLYRHDLRRQRVRSTPALLALLAISALVPVLVNDPRFVQAESLPAIWMYQTHATKALLLLAGICPVCAVLGYLTPRLIDEYAAGQPAGAGSAYAINVLGCILGPLCASYGLLPRFSERYTLICLGLPWAAFFWCCRKSLDRRLRLGSAFAVATVLLWALFVSGDFEGRVSRQEPSTVIRRDYAASVLSYGEGPSKRLLVNGVVMTVLTPITKYMVHLPLAFHTGQPRSALIICFGMGTTYRSALSWNLEATAVELVPSVREAFGFYHADAARVLASPHGRIVVDDGRRYLKRVREKFDVIVIDPPPPVEAAGSSLLYSEEFYEIAKQHLNPNGILQAWFPGGEPTTAQAVFRSVCNSFPHVRCFPSLDCGTHILASMEPIEGRTAEELAARLPPSAEADLVEWSTSRSSLADLQALLSAELSVDRLLSADRNIRITDDQPYNEYFLLRCSLRSRSP